jgi:FMN phosphatase YigB (HAD superfamily)
MTGIDGFIFDLDHTLYSLAAAFEEMFVRAAVAAALEVAETQGLPLTPNEAQSLLRNSKTWETSDLMKLVHERGFDEDLLFEAYGRHSFRILQPVIEHGRDPELHDALAPFKDRAVILTHGSRGWAESIIKVLGLEDIFPPERILAYDDPAIDFHAKNSETRPFLAALKLLGLPPERVAMVEDTPDNLVIAQGFGITTVLVTWGRPIQPEDYPQVDRFHNTAAEFLRSLPPPEFTAAPLPSPGPHPPAPGTP